MKKWIALFGCVAIFVILLTDGFGTLHKGSLTNTRLAYEGGPDPMSVQNVAYDATGALTNEYQSTIIVAVEAGPGPMSTPYFA